MFGLIKSWKLLNTQSYSSLYGSKILGDLATSIVPDAALYDATRIEGVLTLPITIAPLFILTAIGSTCNKRITTDYLWRFVQNSGLRLK